MMLRFFSGLLMLLLFFSFGCQDIVEEQTDPSDSKHEIHEFPVSSTNEAALASFKEGLALMQYPDDSEARAMFDKAIEADPNFVGAYLYRVFTAGSAEEGVPDIEKAASLLDQATEGEKLLFELMSTWRTNDLDQRMEVAKKMVASFPDVPRAHIAMGNQYILRNDVPQARASFAKAVAADPNSFQAHLRIGNSFLFDEPKDLDKAAEHFQKLAELYPDNPAGHLKLGDSHRAKNDLDKALAAYQKATAIDPEERLNYQMVGHVNSFLGNYEAARNSYQTAVKNDPDKGANVLRFAAYVNLYEGNEQAAIDELLDLVDNMGSMGVADSRVEQAQMNALEDAAWVAFHTGDVEQLTQIINKMKPLNDALTDDVGTEEAKMQAQGGELFMDAMLAITEGDLTTAKTKAEAGKNALASIKNPNKDNGYHFLLGQIALKEGKQEEAIDHLKQANPQGGWVYADYLLGKAYKEAGMPEEALSLFKKIANHNFNGVNYALVRKEVQDAVKPL